MIRDSAVWSTVAVFVMLLWCCPASPPESNLQLQTKPGAVWRFNWSTTNTNRAQDDFFSLLETNQFIRFEFIINSCRWSREQTDTLTCLQRASVCFLPGLSSLFPPWSISSAGSTDQIFIICGPKRICLQGPTGQRGKERWERWGR